jgi:hypothetical protein
MKMQDDVYTPLQRWHKQYKHIKVRNWIRCSSAPVSPAEGRSSPLQLVLTVEKRRQKPKKTNSYKS